jgi:hypothetical protein
MIERVAKIVLVADRQFEWQSDNHAAWDGLGVSVCDISGCGGTDWLTE